MWNACIHNPVIKRPASLKLFVSCNLHWWLFFMRWYRMGRWILFELFYLILFTHYSSLCGMTKICHGNLVQEYVAKTRKKELLSSQNSPYCSYFSIKVNKIPIHALKSCVLKNCCKNDRNTHSFSQFHWIHKCM